MKKISVFLVSMLFMISLVKGQDKAALPAPDPGDSYVPLTVKLNPDGTKYIRFILWGQFWLDGKKNAAGDFKVQPLVRRARVLTYAQISKRFMILMHFGINSLSPETMNTTGNAALGPQLFFHGIWTEFAVVQNYFNLGGGLHYWNGISRLTSQSTLNFMTMDNYRRSWAELGLADQFARNLGVYAKGKIGRFAYRVSANAPIKNSLDVNKIPIAAPDWKGQTLYTGRFEFPDDASWDYQGYFEWEFLEAESDKLPYKVGTYLGKKKVLNLGAGFFVHPNGSVTYNSDSTKTKNNVSHFAVDLFYDTPIGTGALTAYTAFYLFDYGPNYTLGQTYGTGRSLLFQAGYLIPPFSKKVSFQPYAAFNTACFENFDKKGNAIRAGVNMFLVGHHAKLTLEYTSTQDMYNGNNKPSRSNGVVLQAQIFL